MRELIIKPDTNLNNKQYSTFNSSKFKTNYNNQNLIPLDYNNLMSVEVCPNHALNFNLLHKLDPHFCSVTWLSPTSTEISKHPAILLADKLRHYGYQVLMHMAGKALNQQNVMDILNKVKSIGVSALFLVRGDRSLANQYENDKNFEHFPYASELVSFIRCHSNENFSIGVAGYPEMHPESESEDSDMKYLKLKVSKGADFLITQATFDFNALNNFHQRCSQFGINIPVIAGIYIITTYTTYKSMVKFCQIPVTETVSKIMESHQDNTETIREFGIYLAVGIMRQILHSRWFAGIHVFSLNNLEAYADVLRVLGLYDVRIDRPIGTKVEKCDML